MFHNDNKDNDNEDNNNEDNDNEDNNNADNNTMTAKTMATDLGNGNWVRRAKCPWSSYSINITFLTLL